MARELARVNGIIEIAALAQQREDARRGFGIGGALLEIFAHLEDGVGAAHERAHGGGVEGFIGFVFARSAGHRGRSIGGGQAGSKEERE
jgi:hypothetical protein